MAYDDLSQFLQAAAGANELMRIPSEVSAVQEVAAVTEAVCGELREYSPVLLFERIEGHSTPVVTNLLGNHTRFLRALGAESFEEALDRLTPADGLVSESRHWTRLWNVAADAERGRGQPRIVRRGPCQQVVKLGKDVDLLELPALRHWPGESRPNLTAGVLVGRSLDGRPWLEAMTAEVLDRETLQLHWRPGGVFERGLRDYRREHRQMPAALVLGGDPLLPYFGSLPWPEEVSPWQTAGLLRNESMSLLRGRSVELEVPADSEMVLEGFIDPELEPGVGTVAAPYGMLVTRRDLPQMQIVALTHKASPTCPAIVHSCLFRDDFICSGLTERWALRLARTWHPALVDLHLPRLGGHRLAAFVSVDDDRPAVVEPLVSAVRSLPMLADVSLIVVVAADIDVRDTDSVWREVCQQLESGRRANGPSTLSVQNGTMSGTLVLNTVTPDRTSGIGRTRVDASVRCRVPELLAEVGWNPLGILADETPAPVFPPQSPEEP